MLPVIILSTGSTSACWCRHSALGHQGVITSVTVFVTPAPVTETSTEVFVVTWLVKILKPPVVDPEGIVTLVLHLVTNGLLHVTGSVNPW